MPHDRERVLGLGQVSLTLVGCSLGNDSTRELGKFSVQVGGSTGPAITTVAALGGKARWFGRLAEDELARMILDNLSRFGVDVSHVMQEEHRVSPFSFVDIDEQTQHRTLYVSRGNVTPIRPSDIRPSIFEGVGLLYLDGDQIEAQVAAAEMARAAGVTVLLDASRLGTGMGELLGLSDIVIASERFAAEVTAAAETETSLIELTRMGPRIAVVTLGADGAMALEHDKLVRQKPIDVAILDRTGAGEVFRGAFAYAVMRGWPVERCVPFANAAAGMACTGLGPQGGITNLDAVLKAAAL